MKIKNRRIISLVVCIGIILAGSAFAIENDGNMEFDTYNYVLYDTYEGIKLASSLSQCLSCGDLSVESNTESGEPNFIEQRLALPFGVDIMYEIKHTAYELCRSCGWENITSHSDNYWEDHSLLPMIEDVDCCGFSLLCTDEIITDEETVVTRNLLCPYNDTCNGTLLQSLTHAPWVNSSQRFCIHYKFGVDIEQSRTVVTTHKCNRCSYGFQTSRTEIRWVCNGF